MSNDAAFAVNLDKYLYDEEYNREMMRAHLERLSSDRVENA